MSRPAPAKLKVNAQVGRRPSLEFRPIPDLGIDPAYQRSIDNGESQALIRRIAVHWDWGLCQPLTVARRDDGSFWVVDGQHRLAAARLRRDIYDLPCVIMASGSVADEAAAFVAMNSQRKKLNALDLFKAALAAGDDDAVAVMGLIEAAGLSLAAHSNWTAWKPGMISNIAGVLALYRKGGGMVTRRALVVLSRAFEGQVLRYAGTIFGGVGGLIAQGPAAIDDELLIMVLQAQPQKQWMDEIAIAKATLDKRWPEASRDVIGGAYAEAFEEAA